MTQSQPQGFLAFPYTGKGLGVLVLHAWRKCIKIKELIKVGKVIIVWGAYETNGFRYG